MKTAAIRKYFWFIIIQERREYMVTKLISLLFTVFVGSAFAATTTPPLNIECTGSLNSGAQTTDSRDISESLIDGSLTKTFSLPLAPLSFSVTVDNYRITRLSITDLKTRRTETSAVSVFAGTKTLSTSAGAAQLVCRFTGRDSVWADVDYDAPLFDIESSNSAGEKSTLTVKSPTSASYKTMDSGELEGSGVAADFGKPCLEGMVGQYVLKGDTIACLHLWNFEVFRIPAPTDGRIVKAYINP
jgi:hypothetical protein